MLGVEELLSKLNAIPMMSDDIPMVVDAMDKHSKDKRIQIAGCNALSNLSCDMVSSGEFQSNAMTA